MTLLHELAHLLSPERTQHSPWFYKLAFQLYAEYNLDIEECIRVESNYKRWAAMAGLQLAVNDTEPSHLAPCAGSTRSDTLEAGGRTNT